MRYFFISDIHGECDMMIKALEDAGFDMEKDTLVNVGDAFDRGPQSKEVLHYFLKCPHRILIAGNHDLRLEKLIHRKDFFAQYDFHNGVPATIKSFCGWQTEFDGEINRGLMEMSEDPELKQYWNELCYAIEFTDLIATHAWLPTVEIEYKPNYYILELNPDWRIIKNKDVWYNATWVNTEMICNRKLFPDKKMLVGHYHAWRIAEHYMEQRYTDRNTKYPQIDCSTFEYKDKAIFIDGMTNYKKGGKVNVYIYESAEKPIIYR